MVLSELSTQVPGRLAALPQILRSGSSHRLALVWLLVGAVPFVIVALAANSLWPQWEAIPPDAFTYLAAGERLNDGHSLYGPLVHGDRLLSDADRYVAPILSPPLIAVLWRPAAALGEWTVYAWWSLTAASVIGALVLLWSRAPLVAGALALIATYPLAIELGAANLNSILLAGSVAAWIAWQRGQTGVAAWIAALLAVLKIVPAFLVLWVLVVAPRGAWRSLLAAAAVSIGIGVAGAGLSTHIDYLYVLGTTADGAKWPFVALACGAAVVAFRRRPLVAYLFAVAGMAVVWAPMLLIALAAPAAFPPPRRPTGLVAIPVVRERSVPFDVALPAELIAEPAVELRG